MGMGQRFNPHTLRIESSNIISGFHAFDVGLFNRRVRLEKILGKTKYKRVVNKVRTLSR